MKKPDGLDCKIVVARDGVIKLPVTAAGRVHFCCEVVDILKERKPRNIFTKMWFFAKHRKSYDKYEADLFGYILNKE